MSIFMPPPGYRWQRREWVDRASVADKLLELAMKPAHRLELGFPDCVWRRVEDEPPGENVWRCECGLERFDKVED